MGGRAGEGGREEGRERERDEEHNHNLHFAIKTVAESIAFLAERAGGRPLCSEKHNYYTTENIQGIAKY